MLATTPIKSLTLAPFLTACLLYSAPGAAGFFFSPDNYPECLLDRLEDVQNDLVAASETSQCRSEFPDSTPPEKIHPLLFGPETVAECLASYGEGMPSPYAANMIREACFQLYPEKLEEE